MNNEKIFTGENDEAVLNCEGEPCNFVYNDKKTVTFGGITMAQFKQVYKCAICGNMIEVLHAGGGTLVCCGQTMTLQVENIVEAANEKHVPIVEKVKGGVLVKVGEIEHPMLDAHYIEWIEVQTANKIYRKYLNPGDKPEAIFLLEEEILCVREYCNLHRLWKA